MSRVEEGLRRGHTDEIEELSPVRAQHVLHAGVDEFPRAVGGDWSRRHRRINGRAVLKKTNAR